MKRCGAVKRYELVRIFRFWRSAGFLLFRAGATGYQWNAHDPKIVGRYQPFLRTRKIVVPIELRMFGDADALGIAIVRERKIVDSPC